MKVKITIALITLVTCPIANKVKAQEFSTHEFGIQLSNLQRFSLIYKREHLEDRLSRFQMGIGDYTLFNNKDSDPSKQFSLNFSAGLEKRKALSEGTDLVYGFAPFTHILSRTEGNNKSSQMQIGVAYILGIRYEINDKFCVSLESMPSVSGLVRKVSNSDTQLGYNLGFYNNIVNLTLAHRFTIYKKKQPNN